MSSNQEQEPVWQSIAVNCLLWLSLAIAMLFVSALTEQFLGKPIFAAEEEIRKFIDLKLYLFLLLGSLILVGLISLISFQSRNIQEFRRGVGLVKLSFQEWSSVLVNFGSMLIVAAMLSKYWLYLLGTLVNYAAGWYIAPKQKSLFHDLSTYVGTEVAGDWKTSLGSGDYEEDVIITREGATVLGQIKVTKSPTNADVGKVYQFIGDVRDGFLVGKYHIKDNNGFDSGTLMLAIQNGGKVMRGYSVGYFDPEHKIKAWEYVWTRVY